MKVLSLFDGMSCGMLALERAEIPVTSYHAFEIDKYAIQVSKDNYPEIKHHGDINKANWNDFKDIDLLIGGSPCQGFSFAGKQLAFDDPRSQLFFEFVKALRTIKPKYFLLENVKMKKEYLDIISDQLGVNGVLINSSLVSAQNRQRYYWSNIPIIQPEDKGITWGDVREHGVDLDPMYYTDKAMEWIGQHGAYKGKKYSSQRFFGIIETPSRIVGRRIDKDGKRRDCNSRIKMTQCLVVRDSNKMSCLTTVRKDTVVSNLPIGRYPDVFDKLEKGKHYRYITPIECERLQTVPDNYTSAVSNSQRYKMLGNGWTVDVIAHILKGINRPYQYHENQHGFF